MKVGIEKYKTRTDKKKKNHFLRKVTYFEGVKYFQCYNNLKFFFFFFFFIVYYIKYITGFVFYFFDMVEKNLN